MNDRTSLPPFEEDVRASFFVPPIRPEFVERVQADLAQRAAGKSRKPHLLVGLRPAWAITLAILLMMLISTLLIGPQRVYAAVMHLLGYIPGVGIVDQNNPIRVLAEPVSVTRDGISITVTSATLTGDLTHIDYRIFGVPGSAYPASENLMGCIQQPYLLLPDGTRLTPEKDFPPVPASVNEAVFVLPCIFNTLPGTIPENWELRLSFVPAPPDLTVLPVFEILPSQTPSTQAITPASDINPLTIRQVLDIGDQFIVMGEFSYGAERDASLPEGSWWNLEQVSIVGADNRVVPQSYSNDFEMPTPSLPDSETWLYQLDKNFVPPMTITWSGEIISLEGLEETAEFEFDAGLNPQDGRAWTINKEFILGGFNIRLVSITAGPEGYSFHFKADPGASANAISVDIDGYSPNCGGGGGGNDFPEEFDRNICYAGMAASPEFPNGMLKIVINFQALSRQKRSFQVAWSPDTTQSGQFATSTPQPGVCLTAEGLAQVKPLPTGLAGGKALIYEAIDGTDHWGLVLYNLDGSGKQVVVPNGNWGSLSPDGSKVVYSAQDNGIHMVDLVTLIDTSLPNAAGFNLQWSPDGKKLAYVGMGSGTINSVFVINTDGTQMNQVSTWSYETVIGWSADSTQIYFTAPFTGGAAWKVFSFDMTSGTTQEQFTIENGTPKFLNAKLSQDGNWISYRGRDNSSLYLVHPDGSDMRLVLDNVGAVGVEWSRSGWLGVNLQEANSAESKLILFKPDRCEAYLLPATLHGTLEGLFIP